MSFTWIPFYRELAIKILPFQDRQNELIEMLKELQAKLLPVVSLDDKDAKGNTIPVSEIDPFTFFANFNRGIREDNKRQIIEFLSLAG